MAPIWTGLNEKSRSHLSSGWPSFLASQGLALLLLFGCGEPAEGPDSGAPSEAEMNPAPGEDLANSGQGDAASSEPRDASFDAGPGTPKGTVVLTYYWVTNQADYSGANDTVLCDTKANPLSTVPLAFAQALALEGTGRLTDGRLLNVGGSCACSSGMRTCYDVLDPAKYPWGLGVGGRALRPFRSIAVDKSFISIGERVYVPAFDGITMPSSYGFVHDGCLSADDVGGGITGAHIDWFVAEKANYRTLDGRLRLSSVSAYVNSPHCL